MREIYTNILLGICISVLLVGSTPAQEVEIESDPWVWTQHNFTIMYCGNRQSDWIQPNRVVPFLLAGLNPRYLEVNRITSDTLLSAPYGARGKQTRKDRPFSYIPNGQDSARTAKFLTIEDPFSPIYPGFREPAYVSLKRGPLAQMVSFELHGEGPAKGGAIDIEQTAIKSSWGYQNGGAGGKIQARYDCDPNLVLDPRFGQELANVGAVVFSAASDGTQEFTYRAKQRLDSGDIVIDVFAGNGAVEYIVRDEWRERCIWRRLCYTTILDSPNFSVLELWTGYEAPLRYSFQMNSRGQLISRYIDRYTNAATLAMIDMEFDPKGAMSGFIKLSQSVDVSGSPLPFGPAADLMQKRHVEALKSSSDWFSRPRSVARYVAEDGYLIRRWIRDTNGDGRFKLRVRETDTGDLEYRSDARIPIKVVFE